MRIAAYHAHWHSTQDSSQGMQYAPRVCTLVLFIVAVKVRAFTVFIARIQKS